MKEEGINGEIWRKEMKLNTKCEMIVEFQSKIYFSWLEERNCHTLRNVKGCDKEDMSSGQIS